MAVRVGGAMRCVLEEERKCVALEEGLTEALALYYLTEPCPLARRPITPPRSVNVSPRRSPLDLAARRPAAFVRLDEERRSAAAPLTAFLLRRRSPPSCCGAAHRLPHPGKGLQSEEILQ
ncbi:unnamed protein product [Merluccius merluccius]